MNLQEEIEKTAYELYEKSGYVSGRDVENWIEAERIVLTRHASQDIEEPEGDDPIIAESGFTEEVEGPAMIYSEQKIREDMTVIEEMEVQNPALGTKDYIAMRVEKIRTRKPAATKDKKIHSKKKGLKGREKYL